MGKPDRKKIYNRSVLGIENFREISESRYSLIFMAIYLLFGFCGILFADPLRGIIGLIVGFLNILVLITSLKDKGISTNWGVFTTKYNVFGYYFFLVVIGAVGIIGILFPWI